jgi:hypothetical protein
MRRPKGAEQSRSPAMQEYNSWRRSPLDPAYRASFSAVPSLCVAMGAADSRGRAQLRARRERLHRHSDAGEFPAFPACEVAARGSLHFTTSSFHCFSRARLGRRRLGRPLRPRRANLAGPCAVGEQLRVPLSNSRPEVLGCVTDLRTEGRIPLRFSADVEPPPICSRRRWRRRTPARQCATIVLEL